MKAYRTYLTVTNPQEIIIPDVPFQAGQVVEVLLLAREDDKPEITRRLDVLLETTQALPHVQALTNDDIVTEIEAHRNGQ